MENLLGFGTGIYTTPEVANILGLPRQKVKRWLNEYWNVLFDKELNSNYSVGEGVNQLTNFHVLIEFFTFYQLREKGITAGKIIKAHNILSNLLKTPYPFATSNILTEGKNILFTGEIGETIKADNSLQLYIKQVIEPFCHSIDFDKNKLAQRFFPMGKDHDIIIDPKRKFGQPVIGETNILTETVFDLFRANEPIEAIANMYELSISQVKDAIQFHRRTAA